MPASSNGGSSGGSAESMPKLSYIGLLKLVPWSSCKTPARTSGKGSKAITSTCRKHPSIVTRGKKTFKVVCDAKVCWGRVCWGRVLKSTCQGHVPRSCVKVTCRGHRVTYQGYLPRLCTPVMCLGQARRSL